MWFTSRSLFRRQAAVGDTVIRFWTAQGAKRSFVYKHAQILDRQILEGYTLYFVEDAIDCEDTRLSVTQFSRLLSAVGFTGKLGSTPVRGIPNAIASAMEPLWNSFRGVGLT